MTKREPAKTRFFSRAAARENAIEERRRLLADRADFVAGSIFLFENRDTEGHRLDVKPSGETETELAGRFAKKFSHRLRDLFHDLLVEDLAVDDELPLYYWPQTSEARLRLALHLRRLARDVNRVPIRQVTSAPKAPSAVAPAPPVRIPDPPSFLEQFLSQSG
jgi:hypothetical protein